MLPVMRKWSITGTAFLLLAAGMVLPVVGLLYTAGQPEGIPWTGLIMIGTGFIVGMGGVGLGVIAVVLHSNDARLRQRRTAASSAPASEKVSRFSARNVTLGSILVASAAFAVLVIVTVVLFAAMRWFAPGWNPFPDRP